MNLQARGITGYLVLIAIIGCMVPLSEKSMLHPLAELKGRQQGQFRHIDEQTISLITV